LTYSDLILSKERQVLNSCYRDTKLAKTGLYAIMNELLFLASAINERKGQYVFKLSMKASYASCPCDVSWSAPCTSLFYDAHCNIVYALMAG